MFLFFVRLGHQFVIRVRTAKPTNNLEDERGCKRQRMSVELGTRENLRNGCRMIRSISPKNTKGE